MTIVAAALCCDHVLVASDSQSTDPHRERKGQVRKLWNPPGTQVLWGFAGMQSTGVVFHRAFQAMPENPEGHTWQSLSDHAQRCLKEAHEAALAKYRGTEPESPNGPLIEVLIAGFAGAERRIVQMDHEDVIERTTPGSLHVGQGSLVYDWYLRRPPPPACLFEGFVDALHRTAYAELFCGPPVKCWEITPSGIAPRDVPPYDPPIQDEF